MPARSSASVDRIALVTESPRWQNALFFLLPVFLTLVLAGPGLLPGRVLAPLDLLRDMDAWKDDPTVRVAVSNRLLSDVIEQFIPWDTEIRRLMSRGEFPWINRYAGDGAPLFANPQTALFSPFTWPRLLLGTSGWVLTVSMKLLAAGFGMFWFCRTLGQTRTTSMISAALFMMAGYTTVWGLHPHTNVFVLLPALAAAVMRLLAERSATNTVLVFFFSALATAGGHPETLFQGVIGITAFAAWNVIAERRAAEPVKPRVHLAWTATAMLAGFLLLAIQVVPFLYLLAESRARELRESAPPGSFRYAAVVAQILPGAFGSPLRDEIDLSGAVPGSENFNERSNGYAGALVFMLNLVAYRQLSRALRRGLILGWVSLFVSWNLPLISPLIKSIPIVEWVAAARWSMLFALFGCAAGGASLMTVASGPRRVRLGFLILCAGALLFVGGTAPSLPAMKGPLQRIARQGVQVLQQRGALHQAPEVYETRMSQYLARGASTFLRRAALPGILWILAGGALMATTRRASLLTFATVAELLGFSYGYLPAVRTDLVPPPPPVIQDLARIDPERRWQIAASPETFPPNLGTLWQIRDVRSYDVLESSERATRLTAAGYDEQARGFPPAANRDSIDRLGSLGAGFLISRSSFVSTRLVGGKPPPAVGLHRVESARSIPIPANRPPEGLKAGAALTAAAAALVLGMLVSCKGVRMRQR